MARAQQFRILVATEGSPVARAAVRTALRFPWPEPSMASGVTARFVAPEFRRSLLLSVLDRSSSNVADDTRRLLATRWPEADARVVKGPPSDVIVKDAKRIRADVIVMGWRGHGTVRRFLSGSVSRSVVRQAPCSVLVTRKAVRDVTTIVIGVDGSSHSRAALDLIARCPSEGRRIVLFRAIETLHLPTHMHLTSSIRASIAAEVQRINRKTRTEAAMNLQLMKQQLTRRGWKVTAVVSDGAPLKELLAQVTRSHADLLVVGARGASGLDRLILGSVADGALNRSPVPVLVVR